MADNIIEINDLIFSWSGDSQPVLDIETLVIARGERVFIQGPSGCGKTSLLNLIGAVATADSGRVSLLGHNVAELKGAKKDRFRADHIGFIFQQFNLVPYLSILENVLLPCQFSKTRAAKVPHPLEQADRLLKSLEIDTADSQHKQVSRLSVGQQQRVAAARALLGAPEIIIADEPTSALDAGARQAFIELLFQQCELSESTLVFVSHDDSLATWFDRKIELPVINRATHLIRH